jgi:hypothetical protein
MSNVNIKIPDVLHKKIKMKALETDKTLKEYIINLMEKEIGRELI